MDRTARGNSSRYQRVIDRSVLLLSRRPRTGCEGSSAQPRLVDFTNSFHRRSLAMRTLPLFLAVAVLSPFCPAGDIGFPTASDIADPMNSRARGTRSARSVRLAPLKHFGAKPAAWPIRLPPKRWQNVRRQENLFRRNCVQRSDRRSAALSNALPCTGEPRLSMRGWLESSKSI